MKRQEVIAKLKAIEPDMRARGVKALYLYGSHARDVARSDSDIDVLVDFTDDTPPDAIIRMSPYLVLEERFPGVEIGYGTRENIVPAYRDSIVSSAIRVF